MTAIRMTLVLTILVLAANGQSSPKKVSHADAMAAAVTKVQPEYPALAKQLKLSGSVELEVVINESGAVESVTPVSGNPVLTKPASEAVKKWKFKPFVQDGAPVKAQASLKFSFAG